MNKRVIAILLSLLLTLSGCGSDEPSSQTSKLTELSSYVGTWEASCTTDYPDQKYLLVISSDAQYWMVTYTYSSASTCGDDNNLDSVDITTSVITDIDTNPTNSDYEDVFIDNVEVRKTAYSTSQVSSWIGEEYCGATDWQVGVEKLFNSDAVGTYVFGTCYSNNNGPVYNLADNTLTLNGRGGFDGSDPAEIIFTRLSTETPLMGKMDGKPWMAISSRARDGFDAGTLSYSIYDTHVADICTAFSPSRDMVLFSLTESVGTYTLSSTPAAGELYATTATLYAGNTNYIVTSGEIVLSTITSSAISGSASLSYNSNNSVTGSLNVTNCP